jgi:DNA-binding beta-propeller fold protein YncE
MLACMTHFGCDPPPLSANGVLRVFGSTGMGPGAFGYPRAISISPTGHIYIVDKTARVQRFDTDGNFETSWSLPEHQAGKPVGISVHPDGRVFVPDTHYHRVIVYDADGNELNRFGELGTGDGQFQLPTDVTFDAKGNIYVSEYNGNDRVTRWSPDFEFIDVVVAGEIDGMPLRRPAAIQIDREQTLWVADACNHRILRFDLDGKLLSQFGKMGTEPGKLRYPYDIDIDGDGTLLVTEYGNSRLQWFDADGHLLRAWGEPGRRIGQLNAPWGAVFGPDGRTYALDSQNARVQIIGKP